MAAQPEAEIVLYDLACTKNVCFSPVVWRIRLMLNYKGIPYRTVFLEFPDIEPTLSGLGIPPHAEGKHKYTVPAIHHLPTDTFTMDSQPIATFLETTYPSPAVPLTTASSPQIEAQLRAAAGPLSYVSVMPREPAILSPRAGAYFRATREEALGGKKLEDLLEGEAAAWEKAQEGLRGVDEMLKANRSAGRTFVGGEGPGLTDFFIAGSLQGTRTVEEGLFERFMVFEGIKGVYEACLPWMERKD